MRVVVLGAGAVGQAAAPAGNPTQPASSTTGASPGAGRRPTGGRTPTAISGSGGQVAVDPIRNVGTIGLI